MGPRDRRSRRAGLRLHRYGGYQSPQTFVDGLQVAIIVGAAVVAVGSLAAFAIPRARRATASETVGIGARELEPVRVPIEG
jgi:hypothetical protein